eukprot:gene781-424_t
MSHQLTSAFLQTDKCKAMMAARLIWDVDVAPMLTSPMVRAVTEAALVLQNWARKSKNKHEVHRSTSIAARRLQSIERKARCIRSNPIIDDVLVGLHVAVMGVVTVARQSSMTEEEVEVDEAEGDLEDIEKEFTTDDLKDPNKHRLLPKDVQLSMEKASLHFYVLLFVLVTIMVISSVAIILVHRRRFLQKEEELEDSVTMTLALIAQRTLNMLYEAMVNSGANIKAVGRNTASLLLADMTSHLDAKQDVMTRGNNFLTEYRGAVQDFANSNQVTMVTTPRAYGGLCEANRTYPIHRINDIQANQKFVVPVLTPHSCGNDATSTGIFSFVVPSYVRYAPYVLTYRRNLARLASFYHPGFGLSVAVTHDRDSLQNYLQPPVTMLGKTVSYPDDRENWEEQLLLWLGLSMGFSACILFIILTYMMQTSLSNWRILFSVLSGFFMSAALGAVYLVSLAVFSAALHNALLRSAVAEITGVTGAVLSGNVSAYNLSEPLFRSLADDLLQGVLLATDVGAATIVPDKMRSVAHDIDAARISRFRRGSYSGFDHGYAVASSYMLSADWNFIVARKLPEMFSADGTIAVVVLAGVVGGFVVYGYTLWSPLCRLRSFGTGSPILRYRVKPSSLRYVYYLAVVVVSLVGMVALNFHVVYEIRKKMTSLSQDTMVLLGGSLRASGIADICTDRCGMPDFTSILYFQKTYTPGRDYPTVSYIDATNPMPYPQQQNWAEHYMGAELAINNVHTTLVNVPSFSTPVVNATVNETDPRYILRNMLGTTGINNTVGFAIERFPTSFYPKSYSFNSHSIGVCIMIVVISAILAISEMEYISLFQAVQNGAPPPRRAYIILWASLSLLPLAFLAHSGFMKFEIRHEMREFALQELAFTSGAVGYRLGLISLDMLDASHEVVVDHLTAVTYNASLSAMLMGNIFFRLRIAHEVPVRDTNQLLINGVKIQEPLNLGSLDNGYIPTCGAIDARYVSDHSTGMMNYCYVEIPQSTDITAPRIFVMAVTSNFMFVEKPTNDVWVLFMGVSVIVGVIVATILGGVLFFTLDAARIHGYPIMDTSAVLPFTEPLPSRFTKEYFMPRHHRSLWVSSILLLGLFLVYYCASVGDFLYMVKECRQVAMAYESQTDLFVSVLSSVMCNAYNFILFPFPSMTTKKLIALSDQAADGTLAYTFVTKKGLETFRHGIINTYLNLTGTDNILNSLLGAANEGYGSYCSLIAARYETLYIGTQEYTFDAIDRLLSGMQGNVDGSVSINYGAALSFLHEVSILRDLLRKLYILDHIAVSSYADFAYIGGENWPFSDDENAIVQASRSAATDLEALVQAQLTKVESVMVQAAPSAKNTLDDLFDQVKEAFAGSFAVQSFSSSIWSVQMKRCAEAVSVGNTTQTEIATQQQNEEIQSIDYLQGNISESLDVEMTARKTNQLIDYIRTGDSFANLLPTLAWERWNTLKTVKRMYKIAFGCTLCGFIVVGACILIHLKMIRYKTELIQKDLEHNKILRARSGDVALESLTEDTEEVKGLEGKKIDPMGESATPSRVALRKDAGGFKDDKYYPDNPTGTATQLQGSGSLLSWDGASDLFLPRRQRWVTVPVGFLLLVALIPFVCSFWLLVLVHNLVESQLQDIAVTLSLYSKVASIMQEIESLLENTVLFYLGKITEKHLMAYMQTVQDKTLELGSAYKWELRLTESKPVSAMFASYNRLEDVINAEVQSYNSIVGSAKMATYYIPQSAYARQFLPTMSSTNAYGSLLPMSITTTGSEMNTFAQACYAKVAQDGPAATDINQFRVIYAAYSQIVDAFDKASSAELMMWHATVAGAREEGAQVAVNYGDFPGLIGSGALAPISTSTDPPGAAASAAVTTHFKTLMDNYGSTTQQKMLFQSTSSAPNNPGSSPLAAYEAAGFVSSYLTTTTTEAKFSNIFGYNRNLTSISSSLQGKPTLVERINDYNDAVRDVFLSLGGGQLKTLPTTSNYWVWYSEVVLDLAATKDHQDLNYLIDGIRWCIITSFWGLLASMFAAFFLIYIYIYIYREFKNKDNKNQKEIDELVVNKNHCERRRSKWNEGDCRTNTKMTIVYRDLSIVIDPLGILSLLPPLLLLFFFDPLEQEENNNKAYVLSPLLSFPQSPSILHFFVLFFFFLISVHTQDMNDTVSAPHLYTCSLFIYLFSPLHISIYIFLLVTVSSIIISIIIIFFQSVPLFYEHPMSSYTKDLVLCNTIYPSIHLLQSLYPHDILLLLPYPASHPLPHLLALPTANYFLFVSLISPEAYLSISSFTSRSHDQPSKAPMRTLLLIKQKIHLTDALLLTTLHNIKLHLHLDTRCEPSPTLALPLPM